MKNTILKWKKDKKKKPTPKWMASVGEWKEQRKEAANLRIEQQKISNFDNGGKIDLKQVLGNLKDYKII